MVSVPGAMMIPSKVQCIKLQVDYLLVVDYFAVCNLSPCS